MLAVLPAAALVLCTLACRARMTCWREAILSGAGAWGVVLVLITEMLGMFNALTALGLSVMWLVTCGLALWALQPATITWRHAFSVRPLDGLDIAFLIPLGLLLTILGLLAASTAPNTWDSMTYHLARLIHWQQNASLAPYPTHILRQLYLQPGAEYALLHLQMLSGGDRLAGLVQWASMLGSLVGVSLIAQYLGARHAGVLCAVAVSASIPIGVLEGTSTQNDWVVTFWLVAAFAFGLQLVERPAAAPVSWPLIGVFGAAIGLALLTKATAYLIGFPLVLWITWSMILRRQWHSLAALSAAGALALALNAGFYLRNLDVFGSPLGPPDEGLPSLRYRNDAMTPALLASNLIRDAGVNLVATPVVAVNVRTLGFVQTLHNLLGVDIQDLRTTWGGETFREQNVARAFDENFAGNPLHLLLTVAALISVWLPRPRMSPALPAYTLVLIAASVLFAAVLRWQPWHSRLELPYFVLCAPLVGIVAERVSNRLAVTLGVLLLVSTVPWVANNQARPLVGSQTVFTQDRTDQYFAYRPELRSAYGDAVARVSQGGCVDIGFLSNQDGWEYPLHALYPGHLRIEHVNVTNASARVSPTAVAPCAVLAIGPAFRDTSVAVGGRTFRPVWSRGDVAVLAIDGS